MDISQNLKTVLDNISNDINVINDKVETKQAEITSENKLDYSLISGAPAGGEAVWGAISGTLSAQTDLQNALNAKANTSDIPLSTSQLTNDSGFVTSSVMDDALSGKQDLITESEWLPATYVHMDINHYPSDPDFTVEAAVNMTRDDVYAVSGVVSGLLSSKQDAITNDNKLDYALLSGTPTIPLSTSQLTNDSDFQTSTDVANAISGKAEQTDVDAISGELEEVDEMLQDYIEEYNLLHTPFYVETREANNEIKFNHGQDAPNVSLKYSYDNKTWYDYTLNDVLQLDNVGDKVYFKGNNEGFTHKTNQDDNHFNVLSSTLNVNAGGNIMSLLDENMKNKTLAKHALSHIFYKNAKLVDASKLMLPSTKLGESCYTNLFRENTALIKAPKELPAITGALACYYAMFRGCTSLTKPPVIKLTALTFGSMMTGMFRSCSLLNEIEVYFTDWNSGQSTSNWVNGVAASGTFKCPAALDTTQRDAAHVPANWTVVNI